MREDGRRAMVEGCGLGSGASRGVDCHDTPGFGFPPARE